MTAPTTTTTTTGKLDPDIKAEWLAALRSGQYQQGRGYLNKRYQDEQGIHWAYCCLGVLCDIAAKRGVTTPETTLLGTVSYDGGVCMPPDVVDNWAFGGSPSGIASRWSVYYPPNGEWRPLQDNNDNQGLTFPQIADLIEEHL